MLTRWWLSNAALAAFVASAAPVPAQLISIKTVPIADGEQFEIFPSRNVGMGGVSIALDDTLLDPFRNPAAAVRLRASEVFGAPLLFSVSSDAGGGRTLPLGMISRRAHWFSGGVVAMQEVDEADADPTFVDPAILFPNDPSLRFEDEQRYNLYGHGLVGRSFDGGLALALAASVAGLRAVDGTELLYARSAHVRQRGGSLDLRLGLVKEWDAARAFEAVLVHHRYRMTHDVTYVDWLWNPVEQTMEPQGRLEPNPDRTNVWGMHLRYRRPIGEAGWRIGAIATANRMSHPKIPNYEIMNIPRDPGHSNAFNLGLGLSRSNGPATFAVEGVWEPIRSHTWAEAEGAIETPDGRTIPDGGRTIENDFRFANAMLRVGASRRLAILEPEGSAEFQFGLVVRAIHYWLTQENHVQRSLRGLEEDWLEWTPTWGFSLRFPEFELRYAGRVTHGTGRPGIGGPGDVISVPGVVELDGRNILAAPSGELDLQEVRVRTHQISVSFPLR